ncbi:MAG: Na/Pi cotransporter family protein [Alphaproteobacteria bacterium]|nr:MAG: Na/Pi cotransporter family protein [Alphaproteobacteria bacterium]
MAILTFTLMVTAAVGLLLYAVRMIRTGVERAYMGRLERALGHARSVPLATGVGALLGFGLQSATAVALLAAGILSSGTLGLSAAIASSIGAEFGSAMIVAALSLRPDWLLPVVLAVGTALFLHSETPRTKQAGRILIGIGLVLVSLGLLRDATEPFRQSSLLPILVAHVAGDPLAPFLLGAAVAFLLHSSVATVLLAVTLAAEGLFETAAVLGFVLGANAGASLVPLRLLAPDGPPALRLALALASTRGVAALAALAALPLVLDPFAALLSSPQGPVVLHLTFNLAVAALGAGVAPWVGRFLIRLVPDRLPREPEEIGLVSVLEPEVLDRPQLALASMRREVLRIGEIVEHMARPFANILESGDVAAAERLAALDRYVNQGLFALRRYASALQRRGVDESIFAESRALLDYAIDLETGGDILSKRLLPLVAEKVEKGIRFSQEGHGEIRELHDHVMDNVGRAFDLVLTTDVDAAHELIGRRNEVRALARKSRRAHLKRMMEGREESLDSSDLHIEILDALDSLDTEVTAIAAQILERSGVDVMSG